MVGFTEFNSPTKLFKKSLSMPDFNLKENDDVDDSAFTINPFKMHLNNDISIPPSHTSQTNSTSFSDIMINGPGDFASESFFSADDSIYTHGDIYEEEPFFDTFPAYTLSNTVKEDDDIDEEEEITENQEDDELEKQYEVETNQLFEYHIPTLSQVAKEQCPQDIIELHKESTTKKPKQVKKSRKNKKRKKKSNKNVKCTTKQRKVLSSLSGHAVSQRSLPKNLKSKSTSDFISKFSAKSNSSSEKVKKEFEFVDELKVVNEGPSSQIDNIENNQQERSTSQEFRRYSTRVRKPPLYFDPSVVTLETLRSIRAGDDDDDDDEAYESNFRERMVRDIKKKAPRSKSGCWTCRVRRKKCPEDKPICSQCVRLGSHCDGYGDKPDFMTDKYSQIKKLREIKECTAKIRLERMKNLKKSRMAKAVKSTTPPEVPVVATTN